MQENKQEKSAHAMLDFFTELLKWRKFILAVTVIGTAISVVVALLLPKYYISFGSIRATETSKFNVGSLIQSSGLGSSLGSLADFALPSGGGQVDYLAAILTSRTVQDKMIAEFKLREKYKADKIEDAREALTSYTIVRKDMLGELLVIGVYDESPVTAAAMTKAYIDFINNVYTSLNVQAARNNRVELESRYESVRRGLAVLEDSLRDFQENNAVYDLKSQTEAAIKASASLKSDITLKEIELAVKIKGLGPDSPEIQRIKLELAQLNKVFEDMINGSDKENAEAIFVPFKKTPQIGLTYFRLFRDIQIQTELAKVLLPLIEQARMQEKRETPSLVVLDSPVIPEKKAKPPRALIVMLCSIASLVISLLSVFSINHLRRMKENDPERYGRLLEFWQTAKSDIRHLWRKA